MRGEGWVSAVGLLAWLCCVPGPVRGEKVLVMPVDGSHWLSMQILVQELTRRGHEMVVLVPDTSLLIGGSAHYRTEIFRVPYSAAQLAASVESLKEGAFQKSPELSDVLVNVQRLLNFTNMQVRGCEALLYDVPLMQRLRDERFQLMLTDPFLPCGSILAHAFALPAVYFLRGIPCGLEDKAAQNPSPPSFVPRFFTGHSDRMDFLQRVKNVVMTVVEEKLCRTLFASFDELSSRYLQQDITYRELVGHGAVWLLRYDFTFEFPRPFMPNMIHIGGINCAKRSPLPTELQKFVNESGEHGFIVFTLGSVVSQMPVEKAKLFFEAFRQIPQRVLWRYTGPTPDNLPENVKLMKWLPQNDLLGHPKARAFITHGGTHGIYEGICNAVPMVMMPLFGDQGDNVQRMAVRGVAEVLSIFEVTTETLLQALNKVINDTSYKDNMLKLSAVHKDRPMEPLDLAVFWTEFVMRHKGADHLRPAAHHLNWVQYHCLDVIGLLVVIVVTVVMVTVKCCAFCFRKCCMRKSLKKKED
ncbi:UDP-glucuronosyltransferase-like isoform X2 [Megalops cyprinoides]|uniref:UDP-glucuronosyltransferase-like isoform X2 n=1 Tax=Megalops cyprinoides TaxID=118141 RepID=UPI0018651364|nr:UDP-glucuronosyltransferase-like isoform X2 [Megalops cyprinoides]